MSRLVLLNGSPGVGKSTLASRYVADHPAVRRLDIDELAQTFDGWRGDRPGVMPLARARALEMIGDHLSANRDVLVPQFVGVLSELERFERVAAARSAHFVHVVLIASPTEAARRFDQRGRTASSEWLRVVHSEKGLADPAAFESLQARLADLVRSRLTSVLIDSSTDAIDQTYARLCAALGTETGPPPPRAVAVVVEDGRVLVIKRRRMGIEYAVLPGGGTEVGETPSEAAIRELGEETTLEAMTVSPLWRRTDDGREASYFLARDVTGTPTLAGDEALEHSPEDSFVLSWATADELEAIGLQPSPIRRLVRGLLAEATDQTRATS